MEDKKKRSGMRENRDNQKKAKSLLSPTWKPIN